MAWFHVFRDRHERRISPERHPRLRYMKNGRGWPELVDMVDLARDMDDKSEGKVVDQEEMAARQKRLTQITPSSPNCAPGMIYKGVHDTVPHLTWS